MPPQVLQVANGPWFWMAAVLVVSVVLLQALLFIRHSLAAARRIGFPRSRCLQAFRAGAVSAVGPSIAVFIIMVGMMAVLGAPVTWVKLSVIGAAPTSLAAAQFGAEACGTELGSPDYGLTALACSWWAMNISCAGWLLFVALFAGRLERIRTRLGGGDPRWLTVLSTSAMLGAFAFLNARNLSAGRGAATAAAAGGLSMIALLRLSERLAGLKKEYTLGLAMLLGMAAAMLVRGGG